MSCKAALPAVLINFGRRLRCARVEFLSRNISTRKSREVKSSGSWGKIGELDPHAIDSAQSSCLVRPPSPKPQHRNSRSLASAFRPPGRKFFGSAAAQRLQLSCNYDCRKDGNRATSALMSEITVCNGRPWPLHDSNVRWLDDGLQRGCGPRMGAEKMQP